ncbi:MAG: hypothetical protein M3680_33780 [Myxococcota bacterium]|nr:hypothetical protein [Myxococcota bacterium]
MARERGLIARLGMLAGALAAAGPGSGCARDEGRKAAPLVARPAQEAPAAPPFRIDVRPPATCTPGTRCEAALVLVALGGFKVNEEYPFKFVGDAQPGLTFDDTGTFARTDAQTGTLTIGFRAAAAGTAKITGAFKLSVCTAEVCEIEAARVAFDVAVR